ncbi:hypothetical protein [Celeribacter arenosi]|uniref:DUF4157 domain-containing protein n=1 Tax=Celeribacter arenosi TaxID=792649 RepID=A0ABP7KB08_9RHOB
MGRTVVKRAAVIVAALCTGFSLGLVALGYTPLLAAICPPCFGFEKAAEGLYVETRDEGFGDEMARRYARATQRVEAAMGPIATRPIVLVCLTETCNEVMGGNKTRAMTYGSRIFYLGPHGHDTDIIAHELTHVVIHQRIGLRALNRFPAWVNEGIATYVSQDARFDLDPATCLPSAQSMPENADAWRSSAGASDGSLYADSGCLVARWLSERPAVGIMDLIAVHAAPE